MRLLKIPFLIVLCFLFLSSVNAQDWINYQSQQQVNDLVDTGNELLLATDIGLVVVNKTTLEKTIFDKSNSNLSNNHIQAISQATDGSIWIGTYDVIMARFDGTAFEDPIIPDSPVLDQNTKLYDIDIAGNGDFWITTSDGVFHRADQDWSFYGVDELGDDFFEAWNVATNDAGEIFIASRNVSKFANGEWTNITENTAWLGYLDADLFLSSTGDLFVAGDLDQIGRYDGQQWQAYAIDFNGSEVLGFTEDTDGSIYFFTKKNGIYKLVNDVWIVQPDQQAEIFNNFIDYFHIDEDNNSWVNSNIHLSVKKNGLIETILIADHTLETNNIQNIQKGENGKLYFITGSRENISILDTDGNWSFLQKPPELMPYGFVWDILAIADDNIWLAGQGGLYHFDGSDWEVNNDIIGWAIDRDSQGKIYVRGADRIFMIDNGVVTEYNVNNSDITNLPLSGIGLDANDHLWLSSGDWDLENVIQKRSTDGTWTTYTTADHPAIDHPVGDFHFDVNGNVWVANSNVGALKFDGVEFTNPIADNISQLDNYKAYSIESDPTGKVYFAQDHGVTTLLNNEFEELIIEDVLGVNTSFGTSIQFDDDGTLWWGSDRTGVFSYTSGTSNATEADFDLNTQFTLFPNPARSFTTLDFVTPKKSNVSILVYDVLGQLTSSLDLGFLPAGKFQHTIDIAQLPKGIYTILLQVDNNTNTKRLIVQ